MLMYLFTTYMQKLFDLAPYTEATRGGFALVGFFETCFEFFLLLIIITEKISERK